MTDPTAPPRPRSILSLVVNGLVSIAILGACVFGYTLLGERERPERSKRPKSPVMIVTAEPLRLHEGPVPIQANGVVVPLREIRLATEIAGRIIEQSDNLRAGKLVDAGETLIRLDDAEYQLEVERLQAQAKQEMSEMAAANVGIENTLQLLELAEEQVALAKADRVRVDSLVRRQAASASEVDIARRAELSAKSDLVGLENQRRELLAQKQLIVDKQSLTEVQLKRAELDLRRCIVRSPIKGLVVTSSVEEQSFVAAGTSFVTIEDTAAVEVRVNLTADQMIWIWNSVRGQVEDSGDRRARRPGRLPEIAAVVSYSFGTETFRWPATLQRIDGSGIDPNTRTYPCLFRVDAPASSVGGNSSSGNPDPSKGVPSTRRLARSMFVGVTIETNPSRTLHEVPESAIRPGNRLWLNANGQLQIMPITIVSTTDERCIVELNQPATSSPAFASASVILSPISDPIEGMAVGDAEVGKPKAKMVKQPGGEEPSDKVAS